MQINVTFNNTQEMEQFCRLVAGAKEVKAEAPAPAPSGPSVPAAPAPAQAPTTQAPVAPTTQAPVAPAAPITQAPVAPTVPVAQTPVAPAAQTPAAPPVGQPAVPTGTVPTKEPGYTLDDLSRAAITLLDAGHQQAELQQLLAQFGVAALPALPQEQYGAFATALRGLGAKI